MAYDDVGIPFESMKELETAVRDAISEFDSARNNSDALQQAIGTPFGRTELRSEVDRFEGAWDDKRETLKRKLEELLERVAGTASAWEELDAELSAAVDVRDGNKR